MEQTDNNLLTTAIGFYVPREPRKTKKARRHINFNTVFSGFDITTTVSVEQGYPHTKWVRKILNRINNCKKLTQSKESGRYERDNSTDKGQRLSDKRL